MTRMGIQVVTWLFDISVEFLEKLHETTIHQLSIRSFSLRRRYTFASLTVLSLLYHFVSGRAVHIKWSGIEHLETTELRDFKNFTLSYYTKFITLNPATSSQIVAKRLPY